MLETFTDIITVAVQGALGFIAAAVGAGMVIFVVVLGLRHGVRAMRIAAYNDMLDAEEDEYSEADLQRDLRDWRD